MSEDALSDRALSDDALGDDALTTDNAASTGALPIADGRTVFRYLIAALRPRIGALILLVLVMTIAAAAGLVVPRGLGEFVDIALRGGEVADIWRPALLMTAGAVVAGIGAGVGILLSSRVFDSVLASLRESMIAAALQLRLSRLESAGSGDLVARATADVAKVSEAIGSAVPALLTSGLMIVATGVGLAVLNPWFAVVLVAVIPVYINGIAHYRKHAPVVYAAERSATAGAAHHVLGAIRGVRTAHAFDLATPLRAGVERQSWASVRWLMHAIVVMNRLGARINAGEFVGMSTILVVGFILVRSGEATVGQATSAMLFFLLLFDPIGQVMMVIDDVQSGAAALGRIVGVIEEAESADVADTADQSDGAASGRPQAQRGAGRLEVSELGFGYGEHRVLDSVSLTLTPGETLAVVGRSGAGKTTLAMLIAGVHSPDAGRIRLDGVDISGHEPRRHEAAVALVTQEVHVFAGSLAQDLRLAAPEASDAELWGALETVGARRWAELLPDGLATVVGDHGHRLTAVQAQQVALARVVLLDPRVVILDEATADAGSSGADQLEDSAFAAIGDRTAVIVAHRLSQAARADRIAYLEDGRVAELGTHDELVAAGGRYQRLWAAWSRGRASRT